MAQRVSLSQIVILGKGTRLLTEGPNLNVYFPHLATHNISWEAENSFISAILPRHCVITNVAIVVLEVTLT